MTVGTEVQAYQHAPAPTGVPRVMNETHRHLEAMLAEHDVDLRPVTTREPLAETRRQVNDFLATDPVMARPRVELEELDALLLLEPTPMTDYARIARLRQQRPIPVVAMINDLMPIQRPDWFQPGADRHYRVLFQQILHVADHVVVPSHTVHDDLLALGWQIRPVLHVAHLGTSFEQQPPRRNPERRVDILYVSTLAPRKGHEQLLRAFDMLRAEGVPTSLTLVGRIGWEVDDLVSRFREHPDFGSSLRWFEHGDDALVRRLAQESTVAVVPAEGEGFGLFLEEGLSAGLPVVARDLPVFRERPYRNVTYVDDSVESLADGLLAACSRDPEPMAPHDVRTMTDFSADVARIILDVVPSAQA